MIKNLFNKLENLIKEGLTWDIESLPKIFLEHADALCKFQEILPRAISKYRPQMQTKVCFSKIEFLKWAK